MALVQPLPPHKLHATFDPARIPWKDSRQIPCARLAKNGTNAFQPRAMHALELALKINSSGYHIYLSGEANLGRSYMLLSFLKPLAEKYPVPPDQIYVKNFTNPDAPRLLKLPPGQGRKLKDSIQNLVANIAKALEKRLETINFMRQRTRLADQFQNIRARLLDKMTSLAEHKGFNLEFEDNGALTLSPLFNGKKMAESDMDKLDVAMRRDLKRKGDNLAKSLVGLMRQLNKAEENFHDDERGLENQAMVQTLETIFDPFTQRILKNCPNDDLKKYLQELRDDILKNTQAFIPHESLSPLEDHPPQTGEPFLDRYNVNLFVDNGYTVGAPVIVEDNPSFSNLLGCVERESEMGALVTDFTLIRPGSLHRANGGFLILHMEDILQHPLAWEGLMRFLRSGKARIEDNGEMHDYAVRTKGLRPEPLDLELKVVLIGNEDIYETLLTNEDRFGKLFRIKAHMAEEVERSPANVRYYLGHIARIINEGSLLPFDNTALAWLVDLGSHICEDQRRLSLKFPLLRELMIEADAAARIKAAAMVTADILEDAYAKKTYRANLMEENFMEDYDRETIKVPTSGSAVGQVNGLSIVWYGDFEFGLPQKISCTVGVGQEGIIDLEREADLGGPIHTKAMMILKSYLTDMFARKKPLVLSASLYFEQSYGGIEGDSASGAELAALLSSLAEVPVRLDLAFTGAVSHSGEIMAVGGVTRKIEGFYKVCSRHGLTGTQGVIIPRDNMDHLMLSPEVLASVEKNEFSIYPVRNIEEALLLLTGMPVGKRKKNSSFTQGSLYDLVDKRLEALGCYAQNAFRRQRKD